MKDKSDWHNDYYKTKAEADKALNKRKHDIKAVGLGAFIGSTVTLCCTYLFRKGREL